MFGIKKLLFGNGPNENLPADVRAAIEDWQQHQAAPLESSHFLTRYVVLDVATEGQGEGDRQLVGIAASVLHQGVISPAESLYVDLSASTADAAAVDRQLAAFLRFVGKSPLVAYHVAFANEHLQALIKSRLGVNFAPRWVDLAWLLPAMFSEISHKPMPLDDWLLAFGLDVGSGRRSAMENNLLLGRLMQMLIVKAHAKDVDTVGSLIDESKASNYLRRTH